MTLDKAIEILSQYQIPMKTAQDHDLFVALLLGREALKREQQYRHEGRNNIPWLLYGETE